MNRHIEEFKKKIESGANSNTKWIEWNKRILGICQNNLDLNKYDKKETLEHMEDIKEQIKMLEEQQREFQEAVDIFRKEREILKKILSGDYTYGITETKLMKDLLWIDITDFDTKTKLKSLPLRMKLTEEEYKVLEEILEEEC